MTDNNLFTIIPYKGQLIKLDKATSAQAYFRHFSIDLLTGQKTEHDFNDWILENQTLLLSKSVEFPRVIHLFYELGFLIENESDFVSPESLLVIDIKYGAYQAINPEQTKKIKLRNSISPIYQNYKKSFEVGYQELLKGNCYQFNLTCPYQYFFEKHLKPEDFIFSLWRDSKTIGAFGSGTYIPFLKKLFLSNSPECLFQYKNNILSTMPIKGTLKRLVNEDWLPLWRILKNDKKSQAELYMITDLLRNDLARIELPKSRVIKKKSPLLVPGLLHQYSQIDIELSNNVNLWSVINKIFPGGSITGAPKKRAMKLLFALEQRERGFYCGSTLILYKHMKSASINIRSAVIDFEGHTLVYQAGGGITLLSKVKDEFEEMTYKHDSFIRTLTL